MILKDVLKRATLLEDEVVTAEKRFEKIFEEIPLPAKETIYCMVSFSCLHCVDVIPKLSQVELNGEFILVTDGEEADNETLINELGFDFPVISYTSPYIQLGIVNTPTCVQVNSAGEVIREQYTENIDELLRFLHDFD
ncbi:hypothetical protein BSK49_07240 [Paenibacillus odorifer]|jgi:hypothetical protein|uniref:Thioredoxin domain-containing protein n=1 Tax=Paenibacillus odorifer TaxID=189426 RepID=A0ABX3GDJ4_9BACL|nr:hypothetical protein [Paenibacillus odorifer]OMD05151.1 hypothetical protein BSO21_31580 [Paenibacillus odorifer]OMD91122.1 hypothetical protein BSK49_07240 [Paenibacillus odorifer]